MVVKISGKPIAQPEAAEALWGELSRVPGPVVLVHGGGVQVDDLMTRLGEPIERRDGIRLTPDSQMPIVAGVLAGQVNQQIVALLCAAGVEAVGLSLASAGVVDAEVDPAIGGRVGRILGGSCALVKRLLASGYLPVMSSIGCDHRGGLLNINADDAAAGIAGAISATRLVMLTDVPGVIGADGTTIGSIDASTAERLIGDGIVTGGMTAKVRAAVELAASSGIPVLVASWRETAAALAEDPAAGTLFLPPAPPAEPGATA